MLEQEAQTLVIRTVQVAVVAQARQQYNQVHQVVELGVLGYNHLFQVQQLIMQVVEAVRTGQAAAELAV
jgi:hypothetical protein